VSIDESLQNRQDDYISQFKFGGGDGREDKVGKRRMGRGREKRE